MNKKQPVLDKKNRIILWELYQNSRVRTSDLAKKVRLSKVNTAIRVRKVEDRFISRYFLGVDLIKIGFFGWQYVLFKLTTSSPVKERAFIDYLQKHPFCQLLTKSMGNYDVVASFLCKDQFHLDEIVVELDQRFGAIIQDRLVFNLKTEYLWRGRFILQGRNPIEKVTDLTARRDHVRLDKLDMQLLIFLDKNPRESFVHLAETLKISPDVVRAKFQKLVEKKVILFFDFIANYESFQTIIFYFFIKFDQFSAIQSSFLEFCRSNKTIEALAIINGEYDVFLTLKSNTFAESRDVVIAIKSVWGEHIRSYEVLYLFDMQKATYLPEGVLGCVKDK